MLRYTMHLSYNVTAVLLIVISTFGMVFATGGGGGGFPTSYPTSFPTSYPVSTPTRNGGWPSLPPTSNNHPTTFDFPSIFPIFAPAFAPTPQTAFPTPFPVPPTQYPTPFPTKPVPTKPPTQYPTQFPTKPVPTIPPAVHPTQYPNAAPANNPNCDPTPFPASNPNPWPSKTNSPTVFPTGYPTKATKSPTPNPTRSIPTDFPTVKPTETPTYSPTNLPTDYPSRPPTTKSPTMKPTTQSPTKFPTPKPTTKSPTMKPTTQSPTKFPTPKPTTKSPTIKPTTQSPTKFPTPKPTAPPTLSPSKPTLSPTEQPTDLPSESPTPSPSTKEPTFRPTAFPFEDHFPPTPPKDCEYNLCGTEEVYGSFNEEEQFHSRMESCCPISPQEACPLAEEEPNYFDRSQGTFQAYCGNKYSEAEPYKESCQQNDVLNVKLMYMREEETECCEKCICYGDPRCYAFDGTFKEFILCDGREIPESGAHDERCIITRNTCLQQKDHMGNLCAWDNPYVEVPNFNNAQKQFEAERDFQVAKYGSPCRYNEDISPPSLVNMYTTETFNLTVQQYERGYINNVFLTTAIAKYQLNAAECLDGSSWEVLETFAQGNDFFKSASFGPEYIWTAIDKTTNIEVQVRCTGVFNDGSIVLPYMNVEHVQEPDEARAQNSGGFCVSTEMPERAKSSYQHSDFLRAEDYCYSWNILNTNIILRNVARAITDNPGVSNVGTEWAYHEFCLQHFSPRYSSVDECTDTFMAAVDVQDSIQAFCKAAVLESGACEESIEMKADADGYQEAFKQARIQYVETYNEVCSEVSAADLPDSVPEEDMCKSGVELQYFTLENGWTTYKVFPSDQPPCNGFEVEFTYADDSVLFEYPLRVTQKYYPRQCTACSYVSTVDTWFDFGTAE